MSADPDVLWEPAAADVAAANLTAYREWLNAERGGDFDGFRSLWRWSVGELEDFWASVWDYWEVEGSERPEAVLAERKMPGAEWFPGARLNYAANVLRRASSRHPALISLREDAAPVEIGWSQLTAEVGALAATLRQLGVEPGDRVVAYLPNCPQAVVGVLATASIGAVWAACGQDFGSGGAIARFAQLDPKVLLTADGYRFGGKDFDRSGDVRELIAAMPSLRATVVVPWVDPSALRLDGSETIPWDAACGGGERLAPENLPFDHPLWVLFSSGTTGKPKGIVQGHGGILLEHLKLHGLMNDIRPGDRVLFLSTTTWMVWNTLVSSLLIGATPVLWDGNPLRGGAAGVWATAAEQRATMLGVGASFIDASLKSGLVPGEAHDLSALRCLLSTGSPLSDAGYRWVYDAVGDVWLNSTSGGTDVCSSFVGGCCLLPVRTGLMQTRSLGVMAEAFDEGGHPVVGQRGELVITEPMPSMPLRFWDDPDGSRYRAAYFERFPGFWRHGDFIEFNAAGECVISGRSDSTLNRRGVRLGTAEIYQVVEALPQIAESLVIGVELPQGGYYMPLFVALADGGPLSAELEAAILGRIREELSPRHLPDGIIAVPAIPHTKTGKKLEVPVKRLYQSTALGDAVDLGSVDDPAALHDFANRARAWLAAEAKR